MSSQSSVTPANGTSQPTSLTEPLSNNSTEGSLRLNEPEAYFNLMQLDSKFQKLKGILTELGSVVVAFSGGVDSTFLLQTARDILGAEHVIALTATSPTYPSHEFNESVRLAKELGVQQVVVDSNELLIPGFADNPPLRCYHCKKELFEICQADKHYQLILEVRT